MLKIFREPINSLTHWAGAVLALAGLIALLIVGWGTPAKVSSLFIYGISLRFLFSASATYHMVQVKDKVLEIFRKVDHAAIYCLIAGTYTPFCVNTFDGFWQWGMLSIIWSLAKEKGKVAWPLRYPAEGVKYENARMDKLGL